MDMLLLSQEEYHPFYLGINSYFFDVMRDVPQLDLTFFTRTPPLGITLLASHLNRNGFSSAPVHNFFTREDSKQLLIKHLQEKPFAVGVSTTHTFDGAIMNAIIDLVKRLSPDSHLIVGGLGAEWNASLRPDEAITVLGPGENTLLSLLKALKAGADISSIPNLSYRKGGQRIETPRADNSPLGLVPEPDWGLYPFTLKRVSLQGSRGCSHACGFCSFTGQFSSRTVSAVMSEIRNNRRKWGINFFRFTDADIAADKGWILELCRALESDGGYSWTCFARADSLLDHALLAAMRRAGCLWVFLGIESGSDKILKAMNKGCGVAGMREGISMISDAGIGVHGNFVVGYPGENSATIAETLDFVRGSGLDTVFFTPFQIRSMNIPVYLNRDAYGLKGDLSSWSHSTMTSDEMLTHTHFLMNEVCMGMETPFLNTEVFFSFFASEGGRGFRENVRDLSRAMRDWHRAARTGDGALQKASAAKVGAHIRTFT